MMRRGLGGPVLFCSGLFCFHGGFGVSTFRANLVLWLYASFVMHVARDPLYRLSSNTNSEEMLKMYTVDEPVTETRKGNRLVGPLSRLAPAEKHLATEKPRCKVLGCMAS